MITVAYLVLLAFAAGVLAGATIGLVIWAHMVPEVER